MMTTEKTARQWASAIWNDEDGNVTWDHVPAGLMADAEREYAAIVTRNAQIGRGIEAGYHEITRQETMRLAATRGLREVSLLPLDVGFDIHALGMPATLPTEDVVLRVLIPAGRLDSSWERAYSHAIHTTNGVTTITSQHRSFLAEILRMAGYKVS